MQVDLVTVYLRDVCRYDVQGMRHFEYAQIRLVLENYSILRDVEENAPSETTASSSVR